jgi:hypothetical protein
MLRVEYSQEASNYFFDNDSLTFELMVALESLVFSDGVPSEGRHVEVVPGKHIWTHLGHVVIYKVEGSRLIVQVVAPVE